MVENRIDEPVEEQASNPVLAGDLEHMNRVWEERALQMARMETATENQVEQVTTVLVRLGREMMGLDVQNVVNIRPCQSITRVPRVPVWVAGVTNLRGSILPVINLWKYFGLPGEPAASGIDGAGMLVILSVPLNASHQAGQTSDTGEIVFLVDDVVAVETLTIRHHAAGSGLIHRLKPEYIQAVGEREERKTETGEAQAQRHVAILNVEGLLKDPRLTIHDEVV